LKIALDVARDQITNQRAQNMRLSSLLADAVATLQAEQALAEQSDGIMEEYASLAASHLLPDALTEGVPDGP
jgi:hypothetical protein